MTFETIVLPPTRSDIPVIFPLSDETPRPKPPNSEVGIQAEVEAIPENPNPDPVEYSPELNLSWNPHDPIRTSSPPHSLIPSLLISRDGAFVLPPVCSVTCTLSSKLGVVELWTNWSWKECSFAPSKPEYGRLIGVQLSDA